MNRKITKTNWILTNSGAGPRRIWLNEYGQELIKLFGELIKVSDVTPWPNIKYAPSGVLES